MVRLKGGKEFQQEKKWGAFQAKPPVHGQKARRQKDQHAQRS